MQIKAEVPVLYKNHQFHLILRQGNLVDAKAAHWAQRVNRLLKEFKSHHLLESFSSMHLIYDSQLR
jgi:hypothetical protein